MYPESDKIDDAAFQLGEIHKDYLPKQEALAVTWYERAWTWNPQTPYPARYNAAVVCDYRLNDRDKALELYRQVLAEETDVSKLNRRFAMRRIETLSRTGHAGTN
jgi:Tfp pilus assembly protein PilF